MESTDEADHRTARLAGTSAQPWQPFAFVGEAMSSNASNPSAEHKPKDAVDERGGKLKLCLANAVIGQHLQIDSLNCGVTDSQFLGMGLIPGAVVEVLNKTASGSVILALRNQRFGLSAELARCIQVSVMSSFSVEPQVLSVSPIQVEVASDMNPKSVSTKLSQVPVRTRLRVIGYESMATGYRRRLLAMGLTPGTDIQVERLAPLGDPVEIKLRGFSLSLRKEEADALILEIITES